MLQEKTIAIAPNSTKDITIMGIRDKANSR